jgi:hypothetical protein
MSFIDKGADFFPRLVWCTAFGGFRIVPNHQMARKFHLGAVQLPNFLVHLLIRILQLRAILNSLQCCIAILKTIPGEIRGQTHFCVY